MRRTTDSRRRRLPTGGGRETQADRPHCTLEGSVHKLSETRTGRTRHHPHPHPHPAYSIRLMEPYALTCTTTDTGCGT
ncbi:unnamed protein product [Danaus chrysippus]|uniref:(African queen) hypothetical protein n=1 Tax=Danaus chrysippus TaxID=151541 RepID=A0A8J2W3N7_9NEOP|nr:unnamed protein product [Danaus chrysippus]